MFDLRLLVRLGQSSEEVTLVDGGVVVVRLRQVRDIGDARRVVRRLPGVQFFLRYLRENMLKKSWPKK
jgi:hypothetical protein